MSERSYRRFAIGCKVLGIFLLLLFMADHQFHLSPDITQSTLLWGLLLMLIGTLLQFFKE